MALLLGLLTALCSAQAPAPEGLEARIEAKLAECSGRPGFVGASVAVVDGGKIVFAKGTGKATLGKERAVRPEDRFSIGSITKQFTVACALKLVEEGKLSLDDPVSKYVSGVTGGDRITLRQLLGHQSGLRDYYPLDYNDREMSRPTTPARIVAKYGAMPLDFEPGTRWSYSNTGYTVMGLAIEKVAHQPLARVMRDRIFRPLGLGHTSFEVRPQRARGVVSGYSTLGLDGPEKAPGEGDQWCGAAGAIVTTATDLARWDVALMAGKALRPASMAEMTRSGTLASGERTNYGLGLFVRTAGGAPCWEHSGGTDGFVSENLLLPERKAAVIVLTNGGQDDPGTVAWSVVDALTEGAVKGFDPKSPSTSAPSTLPTIQGPSPEIATRDLLVMLAKGAVDESTLTDDFRAYLTPARRQSIVKGLKGRGALGKIETLRLRERGGMQVATLSIGFGGTAVTALLYRETNGRIAELFILG